MKPEVFPAQKQILAASDFAVWALPCPGDAAQLDALSQMLSAEYGVPPAAPQLMICIGASNDQADLSKLLDQVAAANRPLALAVGGLEHIISQDYRTIALTLRPDGRFMTLCDGLRAAFRDGAALEEQPCIILLHASLDFAARTALASRISLPDGPITFDRLVLAGAGSGSRRDPAGWHAEKLLRLTAQ